MRGRYLALFSALLALALGGGMAACSFGPKAYDGPDAPLPDAAVEPESDASEPEGDASEPEGDASEPEKDGGEGDGGETDGGPSADAEVEG